MKPIVTVEEMAAIDRDAPEPVEVLIERAGAAVARSARRMLGGTYGRRVLVVAGKGNNGADGRAAARRLGRRGVRVEVIDAAEAPTRLPECDLVIDAAYGTGFRGDYNAPDVGDAVVLAVDIPSGVSGDTGEAGGGAVCANATITFAALKPGLLLGQGPLRAGRVEVADIGLDVSRAAIALTEDGDVVAALPQRSRDAHKWQSAVYVVAGSAGMLGAAELSSRAAMRVGAGMVRLGSPGVSEAELPRGEVVAKALPAEDWDGEVLPELDRCKALVIGPGLGRSEATVAAVKRVVAKAPVPVVVDADGLNALGASDAAAEVLSGRGHATVLTPHDAEFGRLSGAMPSADRIADARRLSAATGAVVLLKGPTTVVAAPDGRVRLAAAGDARLATAGTGDVLSGVIGAFLAMGVAAADGPALASHVAQCAARLGPSRGFVAGDLLELLPKWLSQRVGGV